MSFLNAVPLNSKDKGKFHGGTLSGHVLVALPTITVMKSRRAPDAPGQRPSYRL